jgi:hypothetical protein
MIRRSSFHPQILAVSHQQIESKKPRLACDETAGH